MDATDPPERIHAVVTHRADRADRVIELRLTRADGTALPPWTPGAHIDLHLPEAIRQYSLCGDPADRSGYRIAVLREAEGRGGSAYIHDHLHPGVNLEISAPRNNFPLVPAEDYVFIAGGIGITPILPMLAAADNGKNEWRLVYGARNRAAMPYAEALVERYGDRVILVPEDTDGRIDLAGALPRSPMGTAVYCCGPAGLLDAVAERCAGWPPGSLHVERFTPAARPHEAEERPFEVHLKQSDRTVRVPVGCSIVDALAAAGVTVPTSCGEGTCGTCETTLLEGEADHRDSLLTDEERAANATMMLCVSRARSARLVLDL